MQGNQPLFLTPQMKLVRRLVREQNRSQTEVAAQLGLNQSTVSRTLARADERALRLMKWLGLEDVTLISPLLN